MSTSINVNNSAILSKFNPINPSSINLQNPSHSKPHPDPPQPAPKRFKPNVGGCRTRVFPENVKENISGADFVACCPQAVPDQNEHAEGGQSEGTGVIEEGDPEEGAPVRVSKQRSFNKKYFEAYFNASTLTSPMVNSLEFSETITEFDLTQEVYEKNARPSDLKKLLETLKIEEGFTFVATNQTTTDLLLTFKCPGNHTFSICSSEKIRCPLCEYIMTKCSQYAKQHNGNTLINNIGRLLNKRYEGYIEMECEKEHTWKVKYSERYD